MSSPTPDLLYLLGTDAATSLTNHGSDTGAPAATFINYSLANIANAVSYAANHAVLGPAASLDAKYAPTTSFAVAIMAFLPQGTELRPFWSVRKTSPATNYIQGYLYGSVGPALWDSVTGGATGLPEWGWCPLGVIFTAPGTVTYVYTGRTNRWLSRDYTSNGGNIATNDATGKINFGGAGWASGFANTQMAECSVFKAPPTVAQMRAYLETMRARSVSRGLPVF